MLNVTNEVIRRAVQNAALLVQMENLGVSNKAEQLHISEREAAALVKKMDKQRKSYYDYYTGGNWGKAYNYDFCINSYAKGSENYAAELKSTTESLVRFVSSIR